MKSILLAALEVEDLKGPSVAELWNSDTSSIRQTVIIIGAISLIVMAVVIWAVYIRKPGRSGIHARESERGVLLTAEEQKRRRHSRALSGQGNRRKRRKRRSRPRNPTLAETGGLPPLRGEDPTEDSVS